MSDLQVIPREMRTGNQTAVVESDTTLVPARSLDALANTVDHEHRLVINAAKSMLDHAVRCGEALLEAKRQVKKGHWLRWIDENIQISHNDAAFYMRCAFYADQLRENGIESTRAALAFLRDNELVLQVAGGKPTLSDEQVRQIRTLRAQGLTHLQIATLVGISKGSVVNYVNDPEREWRQGWVPRKGKAAPHPRGKLRVRRPGRKGSKYVAITDDLVEGAAIKIRELFDPQGETSRHRDAAEQILQAAFTYDGPIPKQTA